MGLLAEPFYKLFKIAKNSPAANMSASDINDHPIIRVHELSVPLARITKGDSDDQRTDDQDAAVEVLPITGRGTWKSDWDFGMSCVAYAVGLGNVWRFPYLCFKNGGGAFLIPYFIAMLTCGIPLFLLEVSMGQYLGVGGMNVVGQFCPIFKGVGYSAMAMVFLENIYYIVIVAWTTFYIFSSLISIPSGELPWANCENGNGTWAKDNCFNPDGLVPYNESKPFLALNLSEKYTMTPVESYWDNRVLGISSGIDVIGSIRYELIGCLILAWFVVYFVVWKGIHNSGKIIWVSALMPYIILSILFVKALTLDGAYEGILYLFTPQWDKLAQSECWIDGGTQIFFSYGVGIGALMALGSYNKFHHNCYRDALVVCGINSFTSIFSSVVIFSILGFMSHQKGVPIEDVVQGGPGLAYLVYPEVVLQLYPSHLWSILFFLMLFILGIDSQFCGVESLITGLVDNWPKYFNQSKQNPHKKVIFRAGMCILMFALAIPMMTEGGVYIFQLMDFYAASGLSLLWCVFFQTMAICWIFGGKKVYNFIELMIGQKINLCWFICWLFISPLFMAMIFVFYIVKYKPIVYAGVYEYPKAGEILGFSISIFSMIWIPAYALYYLWKTPGSLRERFQAGLTPVIKPRIEALRATEKQKLELMEAATVNGDHLDAEMRLVADTSNNPTI